MCRSAGLLPDLMMHMHVSLSSINRIVGSRPNVVFHSVNPGVICRLQQNAAATISASGVDKAVLVCFFENAQSGNDVVLPVTRVKHPVVDLVLSTLPAKSASL